MKKNGCIGENLPHSFAKEKLTGSPCEPIALAEEKIASFFEKKEFVHQVCASGLAFKENIVLTGMPGSGKSTVGQLLGIEGFEFVDTDAEVEKRCGCTIRELMAEKGEAFFRDLETEVIREVSSVSGRIISTGGGVILREENVRNLKRNGKLFFLNVDLSHLQATWDRPLSDTREKLEKMYMERMSIYKETADVIVPDFSSPEITAEYIRAKRKEFIFL